jgi:esterase/lipase superfamily enzyme
VKRVYRSWESRALGRPMELLVFGERGMPVIVFPTSMGAFYQWEDFGMIAHLQGRIDAGYLQLWCIDSIDGESFYDNGKPPEDRARRHIDYERYVLDELVPAIRESNPNEYRCLVGASFGAFHAAVMALRHPEPARLPPGPERRALPCTTALLGDHHRDRRRGRERARVARGRRAPAAEGRSRGAAPVARLVP